MFGSQANARAALLPAGSQVHGAPVTDRTPRGPDATSAVPDSPEASKRVLAGAGSERLERHGLSSGPVTAWPGPQRRLLGTHSAGPSGPQAGVCRHPSASAPRSGTCVPSPEGKAREHTCGHRRSREEVRPRAGLRRRPEEPGDRSASCSPAVRAPSSGGRLRTQLDTFCRKRDMFRVKPFLPGFSLSSGAWRGQNDAWVASLGRSP